MAKKSKKNSSAKLLVGAIEFLLAVVALVLLLATPAVTYKVTSIIGNGSSSVSGIACIFGDADASVKLTWAGLLSFIFIAVALVVLCLLCAMALGKKKFALAGICRFVAAGLLIVAGVFVFFEVAAFKAANGDGSFAIGSLANAEYSLGAGWLVAGIVSIVAGGLSVAEEFLF